MAVASLVLGIIGIIIGIFGSGFQWVGAIVCIIGIILGALGRKDIEKKGLATAGLVCSIIGCVLCLALFIACVACVGSLGVAGAFARFYSVFPALASPAQRWRTAVKIAF